MFRIAPQDLLPLRERLVHLARGREGDAERDPGGEEVRRVVHGAAQLAERGVALPGVPQGSGELEAQIGERRAEREGAPVLDGGVEGPTAAHVAVADLGMEVGNLAAAEGVERLVAEGVPGPAASAFR